MDRTALTLLALRDRSGRESRLLLYLLGMADAEGVVHRSVRELSQELGMSKSAVHRALMSLGTGFLENRGTASTSSKLAINKDLLKSWDRKRRKTWDSTVGQQDNGDQPCPRNEQIRQVIEHYRTHHPRSKPPKEGTAIWKLIDCRLIEGYSVDDLQEAIDGNHKSPYHCGDNDQKTKYHDLSLILRDTSHVNRFIEVNRQPPAARGQRGRVRGEVERRPLFDPDAFCQASPGAVVPPAEPHRQEADQDDASPL